MNIVQQIFKDLDRAIIRNIILMPTPVKNSKFIEAYRKIKEKYTNEQTNISNS